MSEDTDVSGLFEAYYAIGAKICEELGHDWEDVRISVEGRDTLSCPRVRRCARCGEEKSVGGSLSTSSTDIVGFRDA